MKYVMKTQYGEQFVCSFGVQAWFEQKNTKETLICWDYSVGSLKAFVAKVHNVSTEGWTIWELSDDLMTVGKRVE